MMIITRNRIKYLFWGLVLFILLLSGCAADQAYDQGVALLERGNYPRAVEKFKDSVRLAEGDKFVDDLDLPCCGTAYALPGQTLPKQPQVRLSKYRQKLKDAKRLAARHFFNQAQIQLTSKKLTAAKASINQALVYDQAVFEYHDLLKKIIAAETRADDLRKEALELAKQNKWPQAVKTIEQALAEFSTMPNGKHTLDKLKRDAYDYYCQLADDSLYKDDRETAAKHARHALSYSPNGQAAKAILKKVANRNTADQLAAAGENMMQAGQPELALEQFRRAYQLYPAMPKIITRITNAQKAICDKLIAAGDVYFKASSFSNALRKYRQSKKMLNTYRDIDMLIEKAAFALADKHNLRAADYAGKKLYGNAIFHDVLNLGYRPDNYKAKQRLLDCRKVIQQDILYTMGFTGFNASPKNQDLAAALDAEALQHLNRVKPSNVNFIGRTSLASVFKDQDINVKDVISPDFRVDHSSLKGVDALIIGNILENKVMRTSTTSYGKTEYQAGMKQVPNPDYPRALNAYESALDDLERVIAEHRHAEMRLRKILEAKRNGSDSYSEGKERDRRKALDRVHHRLDRAEKEAALSHNHLQSTPQYISVPNILPHKYPIQHITHTARVSLFIKVLDTMTGTIIFNERVTGSYSDSDNYVRADSARNVTADPLDLPSDNVITDRAVRSAIDKMKRSLAVAVSRHGRRFEVKMLQAANSGDSEQAVENCIRYLFSYPSGADQTNKMISYLQGIVPDEKDLLNLGGLFRSQCSALLKRAKFPATLIDRNNAVMITNLQTTISDHVKLPCTLIAIDGSPVSSVKQVNDAMTQYSVGDRLVITVKSENKNYSAEIQLATVQ